MESPAMSLILIFAGTVHADEKPTATAPASLANGITGTIPARRNSAPLSLKRSRTSPTRSSCPATASTLQMTVLKPGQARRAAGTASKYNFNELPPELKAMQSVVMPRGDSKRVAEGFSFKINAATEVYIAVHDRGESIPPGGWRKTSLTTEWSKGITDTVYMKRFETGTVNVPGHSGKEGGNYGLPHAAFVPTGIVVSK